MHVPSACQQSPGTHCASQKIGQVCHGRCRILDFLKIGLHRLRSSSTVLCGVGALTSKWVLNHHKTYYPDYNSNINSDSKFVHCGISFHNIVSIFKAVNTCQFMQSKKKNIKFGVDPVSSPLLTPL